MQRKRLLIGFLIVLVIAALAGGWFVFKSRVQQQKVTNEDNPETSWFFRPEWGECEDKDVTFSVSPMDPEVITTVEPMGKMHESHPTPTDHMYILDDKG